MIQCRGARGPLGGGNHALRSDGGTELLKETAEGFVDKHCPPEKAKEWDEARHFPAELWERMAELGWFSLPYPEEWAAAVAGPIELCLIAEALGRASLDVAMAYVGTFIPGLVIFRFGTDEQRERFRDGLLEGRYRFSVAISEPDAGSDVAALRTTAEERGDEFVLNGQKMWCTGAGLPGAMIAMYVRTDPGEPTPPRDQPRARARTTRRGSRSAGRRRSPATSSAPTRCSSTTSPSPRPTSSARPAAAGRC